MSETPARYRTTPRSIFQKMKLFLKALQTEDQHPNSVFCVIFSINSIYIDQPAALNTLYTDHALIHYSGGKVKIKPWQGKTNKNLLGLCEIFRERKLIHREVLRLEFESDGRISASNGWRYSNVLEEHGFDYSKFLDPAYHYFFLQTY